MLLSIIGSSGHKQHLSNEVFLQAKSKLINYLQECPNPEEITLQSGGSSGIDHLAVILFLEGISWRGGHHYFKGLKLHFPCDFGQGQFYHSNHYCQRASELLNQLHSNFSKEIVRDTFSDLTQAINQPNCSYDVDFGFFKRNERVAICDMVIAMTFGKGKNPSDGGTKYTWDRCQGQRIHISLVI